MTEDVLVQVILVLCNGLNSNSHKYNKDTAMEIAKEQRIECFEAYANCAVPSTGNIMTLKEFTNKCLKK